MSMPEARENRPQNGLNDQGLSQEGAIVGNPLADLKTPDRKLSEQEETVLWANKILEEYNALPQQAGKERKRAKNLIAEAAKELLTNPVKIDSAASVWKGHVLPEKEAESSFYELVKKECSFLTRDRWEEVIPDQLAQMVRTYANNAVVRDFAQDILTGYFKGPSSKRQRIDARYTFAFAVLDLIEDQKAFNEAIRISLFSTPIVPKDSLYAAEIYCLNSLPWDVDNRTLQKHLVAQNITGRLSYLALEDFTRLRAEIRNYFDDNKNFLASLEREQKKATQKLGGAKEKQINQAMVVAGFKGADKALGGEEILRLSRKWPTSLILDDKEPLNQKFRDLVGSRLDYEFHKKLAMDLAKERHIGELTFLSVMSQEGFILDVIMPSSLIGIRNKIIKLALNFRFPEEDVERLNKQKHLFISNFNREILRMEGQTLVPVEKFEGQAIILSQRKASGIERNYHPLQSLSQIGFPTPFLESGGDFALANQQLADKIKKTQLRFLNRRGVRIPLGIKFKDFGYAYIDFYKDADDPEKIRVGIFIGDTPYYVKLDRYLNFDFEGKRFDAPFLADSLKFVLLSLLRPILCEEKIKNPQGVEIDTEEKEVVSRMGHLRWLPQGQRFSEKAVVNCFEFEGKDLFAINMQRIGEYKNTPREDQETTYVKPVIEREENLPPVTIHLPRALSF